MAPGADLEWELYSHDGSQIPDGRVVEVATVRDSALWSRCSAAAVDVCYAGILPDLFREGQGIVASGVLEPGLGLRADEVLAKHDENYMPPEVAGALEIARRGGKMSVYPESSTGARQ